VTVFARTMALCIRCFGSGKVRCPSHSGSKCKTCHGTDQATCPTCNGTGKS
jgi:DnaJ-class molecular chaperone